MVSLSSCASLPIHQAGIYRVLISTCIGAYGVSKVSTLNAVSAVQQSTCWHRSFAALLFEGCLTATKSSPTPRQSTAMKSSIIRPAMFHECIPAHSIQTQLSPNCFCTLGPWDQTLKLSFLPVTFLIRAMEQVIGVYSLESEACSPYIQSLAYTLSQTASG